jgi:hypothetical protein
MGEHENSLKDEELREVRAALRPFVESGEIRITKIAYYSEMFGNMIIEAERKSGEQLLFTRDRSVVTCEIQTSTGEWLWISSLLEVLGFKPIGYIINLKEGLTRNMSEISRNWRVITEALDSNHLADTIRRVKELEMKHRVEKYNYKPIKSS